MTAALLFAITTLLLVPMPLWLGAAEFVLSFLGIDWRAPPPQPSATLGVDKLVHFALFFLLAFQLRSSALALGPRWVAPVLLFCGLYAVAIEALQSLTGRTADVADVVADVLGALVFVGWCRFRERRS